MMYVIDYAEVEAVRHTPDWRWLIDREDSPWYPTARLFRQNANGERNEVIERVATELQKFVENNGASPPRSPPSP
ncbi:MAG: hypothetical protein WB760_17355 [Xanthobacteraceae bacterium]